MSYTFTQVLGFTGQQAHNRGFLRSQPDVIRENTKLREMLQLPAGEVYRPRTESFQGAAVQELLPPLIKGRVNLSSSPHPKEGENSKKSCWIAATRNKLFPFGTRSRRCQTVPDHSAPCHQTPPMGR